MGYCVLCGGWDKKQGGLGHRRSCQFPVASFIGSDKATWVEAHEKLLAYKKPKRFPIVVGIQKHLGSEPYRALDTSKPMIYTHRDP